MSDERKEEQNVDEAQASEEKAVDAEAEARAAARAERDKARAERAAERAKKKAAEQGEGAESGQADGDDEAAARAAARAARDKARAERAAERARKKEEEEAAAAKPSPNQPRLDQAVQLIKELVSEQAIDEAYINEMNQHMPTLVINNDYWVQTAQLLRDHDSFRLNYLRNIAGVDMETHMEVVYNLISFYTQEEYCVKVKTDREQSSVHSVTPVWSTANWNEREIYDLLGIDFPGHPDLRRIMMPDDWIGHPLRKDYEPYDPEV